MRFFNTEGPIIPHLHYYLPQRLNAQTIIALIDQQKYFVLHAPRQTGKTTAIRLLVNQLNKEGNYVAVYVNIEAAQAMRSNVAMGIEAIVGLLKSAIQHLPGDNSTVTAFIAQEKNYPIALYSALQFWAEHSPKPIVLFLDEIDSLVGDTLISVLRQLRSGYTNRPDRFPQTVCLVGVRDVRDYRIWSEKENSLVLGGSAFNIKSESLVLSNFSLQEVKDLLVQHTQETGQQFTDEALEYVYYLSQGQPWLVNALAYQACFRDVTDRSQPITKDIIEQAKEELIKRRDTHIDVLVDRLSEPRVRHIMDAIISGTGQEENFKTDDLQYVRDLGLVALRGFAIANPIYQEIIPRELVYTKQEALSQKTIWFQNPDGSLNMHKLLAAFTDFYRENSAVWLEKFDYKESGPHLLLMAFLQRVINGGGKIHREYALGRGRVDLLVEWQKQRIVIELKIQRGLKTLEDGLRQTASYMDTCNATEGHLVIFDRSAALTWDQKIFQRPETVDHKIIQVWGM